MNKFDNYSPLINVILALGAGFMIGIYYQKHYPNNNLI